MKYLTFLFILIFYNSELSGQNEIDTIFYSKDWIITSRDSASFYRISDFDIPNKCFNGEVHDYENGSNVLVMQGSYYNCQRNGRFIIMNGGSDSIVLNFLTGNRTNRWVEFNVLGEAIKECFYKNDVEYIINYSNQNINSQVVQGNGYYYEEKIYKPLEQKYSIEGEVVDSLKHGKWLIRNSKNKVYITEKYNNGVFISSKLNQSNNEYNLDFIAQDFLLFEIPEKLTNTESLLVESGIPIRSNPVLIALKEKTESQRGIIQNSNIIKGFAGLEQFLDDKILYSNYELSSLPENDTIIIQFIHQPDFTVQDFTLFISTKSDMLNMEILNVLKSISRIDLEEAFPKPRRVKYVYQLKVPIELPMPILDK